MENILWKPSSPEKTQMVQLINRINESYGLGMNSYDELHNWSINHIPEFWKEIWDYCEIKHSVSFSDVVDDVHQMPGAKWFSGAKLNFAENLLRFQDDHPAIHFKGEGQPVRTLTYKELFNDVERLAHSLKEIGVQKGDRVSGFIPNMLSLQCWPLLPLEQFGVLHLLILGSRVFWIGLPRSNPRLFLLWTDIFIMENPLIPWKN